MSALIIVAALVLLGPVAYLLDEALAHHMARARRHAQGGRS